MPTPSEYQQALRLVSQRAVQDASTLTASLTGSADERRLQMLEAVPGIIAVYADGSAVLGADSYEDSRARARVPGPFAASLFVEDRTVKIRSAVAWAAQPFFDGVGDPVERVGEVVQYEVSSPFRDTILGNTHRDPAAVGWRRTAGDSCRFCRMLSDRGAVYKRDTATFASHPHCDCTAEQVYLGETYQEASVIQYMASRRNRTPATRARVRDYLDANYGPE